MHQETTIDAEELFENFSDLSEFQNMEDGFEAYWGGRMRLAVGLCL